MFNLIFASALLAPDSSAALISRQACFEALVRGLHKVETSSMARRRLSRLAEEEKFPALSPEEADLMRNIELRILPQFFMPGAMSRHLMKDYRGPRKIFIKRLESTLKWLEELGGSRVAPHERGASTLQPFTQILWSSRCQAGARVHKNIWVSGYAFHGNFLEAPYLIPSGSVGMGGWIGDKPFETMVSRGELPVETFMGVFSPWPVIVAGRIIESIELASQASVLSSVAGDILELSSVFFAINQRVLDWQIREYRALVADRPEFRSKQWDKISDENKVNGVNPSLAKEYRNSDLKYLDQNAAAY